MVWLNSSTVSPLNGCGDAFAVVCSLVWESVLKEVCECLVDMIHAPLGDARNRVRLPPLNAALGSECPTIDSAR